MDSTATSDEGVIGSRLLVFMFTDLVDSTALARRLGDADYVRYVLEPHNRIFRTLLSQFPGAAEVKHTGDGFMATFASTSDAAECGLRLHQALQSASWEREAPRTRVGIHIGEAVAFAGASDAQRDLAGDAANVAARVMGLAEPKQTLMTRVAFDSARQSGRVRGGWDGASKDQAAPQIVWLNHGRYRLKGADEPIELCEVGVAGLAPLSPPADSEKAQRAVDEEELELLGWRPSPNQSIPQRDDWVLEGPLGAGGFGEVWLARHRRLHERRAFKFCFDPERVRSFKRELTFFRLIRDHLGERSDMARLYEVQVDRPPFYLEGEYVAGGNLKQWAEARGGIHTLPLEQRLQLTAGVAQAVAAAHSLGIIHKDLKPSNVLIEEVQGQPRPKLVDFGIGVLTDRTLLDEHQITETGFTESLLLGNESSRTGTRLYQPPEADLNRPATTSGDIYALGVMLYQLVTADLARPLGTGWEEDIEDELLREDIRACTHRDPDRRLGSPTELAERLNSLDQRRQALLAERQAVRQARRLRQLRIGLAIGAVCLIVLGSLAALSLMQWRRAEWERKRAAQNEQRAIAGERDAEQQRDAASAAQKLAEENAEAARQQTELARQRLALAERSAYNLQLRRVRDIWRQEPGESLLLLEDRTLCPEHLREFTWEMLAERVRRDQLVLRGHQGPVRAIAFVPDKPQLISGGYDGSIRLWDLETGRILSTLHTNQRNEVLALALSPDGKQLAACHGSTVEIWSLESGQSVRSLGAFADRAAAIAYAPDGQKIAIGDVSGGVRIWDVSTGQAVHSLKAHSATIHRLAYSPDGKLLALASHDGNAGLWDAETGKRQYRLSAHQACVRYLSFAPDGQTIATGSEDRTVRLWDVASGVERQVIPFHQWVTAVAFSADGETLVTVDQGREITLKPISTAGQARVTHSCHRKQIWALAFSADGTQLATASDDGDIIVRDWDALVAGASEQTLERSVIHGLRGAASSLAISPDGSRLAVAEENAFSAAVWDPRSGQRLVTLEGHKSFVRCVCFNHDATMLATGAEDNSVRLWDPESGAELAVFYGHVGSVSDLKFSADGQQLLSCSENRDKNQGEVRIYSVADKELISPLPAAGEEIWTFTVSADGKYMVTGGGTLYGVGEGRLTLWDLAGKKQLRQLDYPGEIVYALEYSPDGSVLVSGAGDGQITFWDPETFQRVMTIDGHSMMVHSLAFSPDGRTLASAGHDGFVKLWDPVTGHERATLDGHLACVRAVVFSPDSKTLYSGSEDRTIRVWGQSAGNLEQAWSGLESFVLSGHTGIVGAVAFHPNGQLIASAGESDKSIRVWDVEKREPVAVLTGHQVAPRSVAFSAAGQLFSSGADTTIRSWDIDMQQQQSVLEKHSRYVSTFAISPDGQLLVSGAEDKEGGGELFVWDLTTGQVRTELRRTASNLITALFGTKAEEIWSVAISPDGKLLASGGGKTGRGELLLWNLAEGTVEAKLEGHADRVRCVAFSPDGTRLASCDRNGRVCVTDLETEQPVTSFSAHGDMAFCVRYSPDGRLLATCGNDWLVRIWDARTFAELATLHGHAGGVRGLDFSPNSRWLVSCSEDQTVRVWDLDSLPRKMAKDSM